MCSVHFNAMIVVRHTEGRCLWHEVNVWVHWQFSVDVMRFSEATNGRKSFSAAALRGWCVFILRCRCSVRLQAIRKRQQWSHAFGILHGGRIKSLPNVFDATLARRSSGNIHWVTLFVDEVKLCLHRQFSVDLMRFSDTTNGRKCSVWIN
jgi:hypothetical protein